MRTIPAFTNRCLSGALLPSFPPTPPSFSMACPIPVASDVKLRLFPRAYPDAAGTHRDPWEARGIQAEGAQCPPALSWYFLLQRVQLLRRPKRELASNSFTLCVNSHTNGLHPLVWQHSWRGPYSKTHPLVCFYCVLLSIRALKGHLSIPCVTSFFTARTTTVSTRNRISWRGAVMAYRTLFFA